MRQAQGGDRGQSVLLIPAGFMILVLLAALVLEAAALHLRQRQLVDLADSIANDAAAVGFDVEEYRSSGAITIDEDRARSILADEIAISLLPSAEGTITVQNGTPPSVTVSLRYDHTFIIGRNLFGGIDDTLDATGHAELVLSTP